MKKTQDISEKTEKGLRKTSHRRKDLENIRQEGMDLEIFIRLKKKT